MNHDYDLFSREIQFKISKITSINFLIRFVAKIIEVTRTPSVDFCISFIFYIFFISIQIKMIIVQRLCNISAFELRFV